MSTKKTAAASAVPASDPATIAWLVDAEAKLKAGASPLTVFMPDPKHVKSYETRAERVRRLNGELSIRAAKFATENDLLDPDNVTELPEGFVVDPNARRAYEDFKTTEGMKLSKSDGYTPGFFPIHTPRAELAALRKLPETSPVVVAWRGELDARPRSSGDGNKTTSIVTPEGITIREGSITHAVYRMLTEGPRPITNDDGAETTVTGYTKDEMTAKLVELFPEHNPDSLYDNVSFQITDLKARAKLKGVEWKCGRDDAGRYSTHIEGVSKARVVDPALAQLKAQKDELAAQMREHRFNATATSAAMKAKLKAIKEGKSATEAEAVYNETFTAKLEELRAGPKKTTTDDGAPALELAPGVTETFTSEAARDAAASERAAEREASEAKKDRRAANATSNGKGKGNKGGKRK